MKNKHSFVKTIFLTIVLGAGAATYASDFRDASWGMSLRDVLALHPGELPADRKIGYLTYDSKLANLDVKIFYRFDSDDQLSEAGYLFMTEDREDVVLEDYERLNDLLRKRYPSAAQSEKTWSNDLFQDKPEEWARAIRVGHLVIHWEHEDTGSLITHSLTGTRREVTHILSYTAAMGESLDSVLDQL